MSHKIKLLTVAGVVAILLAVISSVARRPTRPADGHTPPLPYIMKCESHPGLVPVPGDCALQDRDIVLLLSSSFLERPPLEVIACSLTSGRELWRTKTVAPPIRALEREAGYLVATDVQDGAGHLICLAKTDGRILWERTFCGAQVALASAAGRVWAAWAEGIVEIDPENGRIVSQVAEWSEDTAKSSQRAITAFSHQGKTRIVASAGRDLFAYSETGEGWHRDWRFRAAGRLLELHPVRWPACEDRHILALAQTAAYDIRPDGSLQWRVLNSDVNQYASLVRCGDGRVAYAFCNPLHGIYLVDQHGLLRSFSLPGGAFRLGPIPLPLPANIPFGLSSADLTEDNGDEIVVRSLDKVFLFACTGRLLAGSSISSDVNRNLIVKMRNSPRYQPFILNKQIYIISNEGIMSFSVMPRQGGS